MDAFQLIQQVFSSHMLVFIFLALAAISVAFFRLPWTKGKIGEAIVNLAIKHKLDSDEYRLYKDLTIPAAGGTTQIDHLIVSKYGLFVIETKNMKGWIFGKGKQKTWTQKIYKQSYKFQNPLHQNYRHVKTLEVLLGLESNQLFSIVIFIGDCVLKTEMPENVFRGNDFIRFIREKQDVILDSHELEVIDRKLQKITLKSGFATDRAHVKSLKKRKSM